MTLREYLDDTGLKQKWMARQLGIGTSVMSGLVKGHRLPNAILAEKIRLLTNDKVVFAATPEPPRIGTIAADAK